MLVATCHCGAVRLEVPRVPETVASCNCSICRRNGTLWAYYPRAEVRVTAADGATDAYIWGDRMLRLVRCRTCGCVTHWEHLDPAATGPIGVNARNLDPAVLAPIPIRLLDNAGA